MTKSTWWGLLFCLQITVPMKSIWDGSSRLDLKQRPWRNAAYWFAPPGFLRHLSYTGQAHLSKGGTVRCGSGPSISIRNQENAHNRSDGSHYSLRFLFPPMSRFVSVESWGYEKRTVPPVKLPTSHANSYWFQLS